MQSITSNKKTILLTYKINSTAKIINIKLRNYIKNNNIIKLKYIIIYNNI